MEQATKRQFKDLLYDQFARVGRALANSHRLELLDLLAQGERPVEELAQEAGLSIANASQHLQTLRAAHLVSVRREGVYMYYRLADTSVRDLWLALRHVGDTHLAEIDRLIDTFLTDRSQQKTMSSAELSQQLEQDAVTVIDVRPMREYQAGHIPQARSLPITELTIRLAELPKDRPIVAYCRGPYCVFADEAATVLGDHGYHVYRLADGLPEWQAYGFPIVVEQR